MADLRPRIALTAGEPGGIGPDLCVQIAARGLLDGRAADVVAVADPDLLRARARRLGLAIEVREWSGGDLERRSGTLYALPVPLDAPAVCGTADPANARYVLKTLETATHGCLDGRFDALVTGPVHKAAINQAGIPFTGHTEYLADLTGTPVPVMMLMTTGLRVALVTTHLALKEVVAAVTRERVEATLRIASHDLQRLFGLSLPRILVCGLNPHAGEGGELGTEDEEIVRPAIEALRAEGLELSGPHPADTAFVPERLRQCDLVVAMYHDQGLPVLKHLGFGEAVNVTLGLPMIRTSVDHGTALALAGTGRAHDTSLIHALDTAVSMARAARLAAPAS